MPQYIIKKGDTLSAIAKNNNIKLKDILSINDIENPDYIQAGWKINLPNQKTSPNNVPVKSKVTPKPVSPVYPKTNTPIQQKPLVTNYLFHKYNNFFEQYKTKPDVSVKNKPVTTPSPKQKTTDYSQFFEQYKTNNPIQSKTVTSPIKSANKPIEKKEETTGFFDNMEDKVSNLYKKIKTNVNELYQDGLTAIDQQFSKKNSDNPIKKIDDSFIDYGYKELGTYKDESFRAGKTDSLLSAINVFDNDKGFDYVVSPKVKEGKKTFNNVKGVAHFLMDSDITSNQKYTEPYTEKGNNIVKSSQIGKFVPYLGKNPNDYVMYYKDLGNNKMNIKYGQLKDKDKFLGYEQIKVRNVPFGELDFNKKTDAGFAKNASYIGTIDDKQTSIITDPESNDVYGRFSGGSGIFHFKEPKTGKTISVDVSGSVNTIKQVGEELCKKYNVDPMQLQFLYHDMGSYSAKPKSKNGVLSNEQWENYNTNNKGYSGAALMFPKEFGGKVTADTIYTLKKKPKVVLTPDDIYENGGIVQAWIQKFQNGGLAQELNSFSTQYSNWNINEEFNPYSLYNTNPKIMGNKAQRALPENTNTFSSQIPNKDGKMPMGDDGKIIGGIEGGIMSKTNPADAILGGVNMAGDVVSGALTAFAKPGSKGAAYAEGSQMAQSIVKPLEDIPIVGQASKLISGIIGGALGARKQGIRNKEEDKQFKLTEYLDRNLITATTPSYYGQYHAKYGANPKMMEQRIIDDIYSDFDKYLKIV